MTIKERIYSFIEYKGITVKKFEEMCKLSNGYVSSMRKGFGEEKLNNVLTQFPDLNRNWLLFGEGEMLKQLQPFMAQPVESDSRNHSNNVLESIKQKEIDEMKLKMFQNQKLVSQLMKVIDNNTMIIKNLGEEIMALKTMIKMERKYRPMKHKDTMNYWANEVSMDADGFEEV